MYLFVGSYYSLDIRQSRRRVLSKRLCHLHPLHYYLSDAVKLVNP